MHIAIWLFLVLLAGAFIAGALIFRNNIAAVNKLLEKGEAAVDKTGKIISVIKGK